MCPNTFNLITQHLNVQSLNVWNQYIINIFSNDVSYLLISCVKHFKYKLAVIFLLASKATYYFSIINKGDLKSDI